MFDSIFNISSHFVAFAVNDDKILLIPSATVIDLFVIN